MRVAASAALRGVAKKTRARVFDSRIEFGEAAIALTSFKGKCGIRGMRLIVLNTIGCAREDRAMVPRAVGNLFRCGG